MNRLERIFYQITIVVIFIFTASLQAGETLHLIGTKGEYALRDSLMLLEDKTGKLTIDEIRGEQYQTQFVPLGPGRLNRGFSRSAFWLRLKLSNHSKSISRWVLQQDFSNTHYMDVYIPAITSGRYVIKKSGNFRSQKNKELFYRKPVFNLSLPYQQEKTIYIRIKSEAAISLALRIWSPTAFIEKVSVETFWLGIFYGILAIMVFYNFFLFLRLYDKNFLYLALFIGFGILMLLFYDGISQLVISEKLIELNRISLPIFLSLTLYFLLKFTNSFMPLRDGAFLIGKMGTGLQILWLLAMIIVPFSSYIASVQSLIPLVLLTLSFSAYRALACKQAQNQVNKYVYIAWVLLMLGIGGVILTRLGLINSGFIVEHGIRFGLVCFVLFMSLALADQIRQTKLNEIKAIKALSDSEAQRNLALKAGGMGIWSWDIPTGKVFWSSETEAIFGIGTGLFPGTFEAYDQFIYPDDRQMLLDRIQDTLDNGKHYYIEHRINRADGEKRWVCGSGKVEYDSEGAPKSMLGTIQDITKQKQQQQEKQASEVLYRDLFTYASDGFVIRKLGGEVVVANPAICAIYGYTHDEYLDLDLNKLVHRETEVGRREFFAAIEKNEPYFAECLGLHKDGSKLFLEIRANRIIYNGEPHVFTSIHDISERQRAEEAREKSEAKYRVLFEYAYDAIVIVHASSNTIIDCNNSSLNVFGRTREEIIGCTPIDLSPERQYDGVLSKIRSEVLLKDVVAGKHRQFEWLHMRLDGTLFDAEVALSPVQIGGENMIQAIVRDITNEKRVQNAIKHIAAGVFGKTGKQVFDRMVMQLAELFNASYAFIGLLDKDDKGVINTYSICADGKILENVSYTVKGTPCENIIDQSNCTYPDSVQQQFPQDILLEKMGVEGYIGMPLFDSRSVPLGLISVMSRKRLDNISYFKDTLKIFAARAGAEFERLETEKRLVDVKQKLSLHVQQTPLGVIEWDTDFRVVEWNHSAEGIFGYSRNEALGCTASELLIPKEALVHVDKIWDGLLKNKGGERSTNKNTTKSNEIITCEWYNTPLVTTEGKVIGVASMVSDISDRVKADEELGKYQTHLEELVEARTVELKQANKELESFSYSISHDLRAPLRSIDGFSHILLDEYSAILDQSGKEHLQRVCSGSQKMAHLIDDLLKLSQVNRANIEMKAVNLSSLISESFSKLQEYDTNREATLTIMPDVIVQGDQHLLAIAIDNLAGNAWKYTSKATNTVIGFGVEELNGEKVYCIKDNGVGFDMKYADKLFGAFQRLHGGNEFEGSGIGLATVSRIIGRHGGRIWANAQIDCGAKFSFTLNRKI